MKSFGKKLCITAALSFIFLFVCGCSDTEGTNKHKPITGIDPCFEENLGYYNESPNVVRMGNIQYMFYTRNVNINDNTSDTIAVRRAEWRDGKWNYGEAKTVLSVSDNGWDSGSVFSADVVKGEFLYEGETYAYLMAYAGSEKSNRNNAEIGFAVSNSIDGNYIRVGENPVVTYDKTEQTPVGITNYKGVTEPSLVSYDKKGKLTLFYSFYGKFNCSYAIEMDCSDLGNIIRGGRMKINVSGLADGSENTTLYSADYAYDPDENLYVVCRNYSGAVSGLPAVSEAVQPVIASADRIFEVSDNAPMESANPVWTLYNAKQRRIGAIHTAVNDEDDFSRSGGYKRIYNGCIASDEYGYTVSSRSVDIYFTSSAVSGDEGLVGDEYLYTPMIHEFPLERG